jgi:hypothetical protein
MWRPIAFFGALAAQEHYEKLDFLAIQTLPVTLLRNDVHRAHKSTSANMLTDDEIIA